MGGDCIPLDNLQTALKDLPRSQCIVLYCATGKRSRLGCELLQLAGFNNVFYLTTKPCSPA
jgi:rhodanese-related sulfurtransferase